VNRAAGAFEHWACIYDDDSQFLETVLPFLADGLTLGEPVLAVTTPANLELLGAALGERSTDVDYAESAFFGRRPPRRVAAFYRYWKGGQDRSPGRRVRIVAEPVWAGRSAREITARTRMEAALNVTLASTGISMICPYDARTTDAHILADALRTHPARSRGRCTALRRSTPTRRRSRGRVTPGRWHSRRRMRRPSASTGTCGAFAGSSSAALAHTAWPATAPTCWCSP
jgi:MEDS: MEthanogen/methylotroph, DcmR Sensory domain